MARPTIPDASTLLCERCGYEIGGIDSELCPECARPIADSLPEARRGSAFQRNPGVLTWLRTGRDMLRHPAREYRAIRVDPDDGVLLWANCGVAGILLALAWPVIQHDLISPGSPLIDFMIVAPLCVLAVRLLVAIEQWGTVVFGRRRGWRITRPIARAICAHAAVGWVVAGALALVGWLLGMLLETSLRTAALGAIRPVVILSPQWMPVAGILVGMLLFETLSYVGMRRMRFVNTESRRRRDSPRSSTE